jgi:hypothetical protein
MIHVLVVVVGKNVKNVRSGFFMESKEHSNQTDSTKNKVSHKEIAKAIIEKKALQDYRMANDCPFQGIIIGCQWDYKDEVKETIYKALEVFITE